MHSRSAWPLSPSATIASFPILVALMLAGCRGEDPTSAPPPEPGRLSPIGDQSASGGSGQAGAVGQPESVAVATWTPPYPVATSPASSFPGPIRIAPPAAPTTVPPLGEIPVPTTRLTQPVPDRGPPAVDPAIVGLMAQVQPVRLAGDVNTLAGFGTRHVLSETDDAHRGIGVARGWLFDAFDSIDGTAGNQVQVSYEDFRMRLARQSTDQRNVIANLPGISLSKRFIYVTAHYDSRTVDIEDGDANAPGADDNASGTAALLELARVLAGRKWDATIRLMAFAANETDLEGSAYHAPKARKAGIPLLAVFNNDIIGSGKGPGGSDDVGAIRVFSEGPDDGESRRLARYAKLIGERYSDLEVRIEPHPDREGREGDHLSFSKAGFAAVRIIEANEDLTRQHNALDTMARIDPRYHAEVVRLNLAVIANLALAPAAPEDAPELAEADDGSGALRVAWAPVDDPMVAGYWVAVRGTDEQHYTDVRWAGNSNELVLDARDPLQPVAVAIASADDLGHTSLFSPEANN